MFYLSLAKVTFLPRVLENELNSASGFPPSVGSERVARSRKCPPSPARRAFTRVACDVTADMSGVGAREVELGQFVIGLSSASVVPLVSLREQFRNVWLA